ncbi:SUKH-4 family immunity protein [Streptomyces sp. NPDC006645]|uniref:SUKH-4 family immunity protein n=1 Tax=unclassified Streptomyces TaxID=2593676 RepID=UPI0033B55892
MRRVRFAGSTTEQLFLSTVGLPDTEWFMSKAGLGAADFIGLNEWYGNRGGVPDECRDWLVLGLFAETTLALGPDSGTVYSLGDGETRLKSRACVGRTAASPRAPVRKVELC